MWWLALRNLRRNPRRTGITLAAISVGVWALVFIWAFIDGINEQMIVNNIQYLTGHIKVHRLGYHKHKVQALALEGEPPELSGYGVMAIAPRVEASGLISRGGESATAIVLGVDPVREIRVTTLHKTLVAGRYLSGAPLEVVLGDRLARELGLQVGDNTDLVVQAADGSLGADRFTLVGVFSTGIDAIDESLALMSVADAQDLYSLQGRYNSWVVSLSERSAVARTSERLAARLGMQIEVLPWYQLLPSVVQAVNFHEAVAYVVLWVVFVVVAVGIANTLLMPVMERLREFGVMRALGTQAAQLVQLVVWESLLLALAGIALGNLIDISFTYFWSRKGMDLSGYGDAMSTMPGLSGVVYPLLRVDHLLLTAAVVLAVCLVPALAPAWRAGRLKPVDAIRGRGQGRPMALEHWLRLPWASLWVRLAWRNLLRNPRRASLTAGATAFGMAAFLFLYAFADGFFEQMIGNSTGLLTSHVQIKVAGTTKQETVFDQAGLDHTALDGPGVAASSLRLVVQAMAGSARKSIPVRWVGVVPETEVRLTHLHGLVTHGTYLPDDGDGLVIGQKLADELQVALGHKLVITSQAPDGQLVSTAERVTGIYRSGSDLLDGGYLFSPIGKVQTLLGLVDGQISQFALRLSDRHDSQDMASRLNQRLMGTSLEAQPWENLMPVVVQMVDMTRVDFYLILGVIFVVVGMGVMNTMLMSVLERTREFGVLLALGTEPSQVLRTLMYEAAILGIAGLLAGSLAGMALAIYFQNVGIDLSAFVDSMEAIPGMTDRVYPKLIPGNLWLPALLLFCVGLLASAYPALKAARLQPVAAIHG
jgi:ABC-type lipoprotein release transport system permease subunit